MSNVIPLHPETPTSEQDPFETQVAELFDSMLNQESVETPDFIAAILNAGQVTFYDNPEAYSQARELFIRIMIRALHEGQIQFGPTPLGELAGRSLTAFIASTLDVITMGAVRHPENFEQVTND